MDEVAGNAGGTQVKFFSTENRLRIIVGSNADLTQYEQNRSVVLAGTTGFSAQLNGRNFVISGVGTDNGAGETVGANKCRRQHLGPCGLGYRLRNFRPVGSVRADKPGRRRAYRRRLRRVRCNLPGAKEGFFSQRIIIREDKDRLPTRPRVLLQATGTS